MFPSIGEMLIPECFPCPVCTATEGQPCDPDCYAWFDRARVYYVDDDVGRRLLEANRRAHLAREAAKLAASRPEPVAPAVEVVEKPVRKPKRRKR